MMLAQSTSISLTAALLFAVVAAFGYVLGRRRPESIARSRAKTRHEVLRALAVAQELETITYRLRKSMSFHLPSIVRFNNRLHRWERTSDVSWHDLCDQADEMLKPTLRLSTEISHAYDDLLQQMTHLSTFAELRNDPLTGVRNRRAFDDSLEKMLDAHQQDELPLSIAMLDLDHFKKINDQQGHLAGDRVLLDLVQLIGESVRPEDVLARFGGEEFVLLLPHRPFQSACDLSERIRARVADKLPVTVSLGVAAAAPGEKPTALLSRVDAALYAAKQAGRNCVCVADGSDNRILTPTQAATALEEEESIADGEPPRASAVVPIDSDAQPSSIYHGEAC